MAKPKQKKRTKIGWLKRRAEKKRRPGERRKYDRQKQTNRTGGVKGRATYYHPKYCKEVIELGKEGKSPMQVAAHFGVARSTITQRWRKAYPDFNEAYELYLTHAQAYWEERLSERVMSNSRGGGPAVTALTFMLARRFRDDYRDSKEVTGPKGTPLVPYPANATTKDKVKAYLDAVKQGSTDEADEL
jgi:hypothetical protein